MEKVDYYSIANRLLNRKPNTKWHAWCRRVMPELISNSDIRRLSNDKLPDRICSRAKSGVLKLVSAHINYITPRGTKWFSYTPNKPKRVSEDDKNWYAEATQCVQALLEQSNFYSQLIATITDRVATGTGLMLIEEGSDGTLQFSHIPAGTYAIDEDNRHNVDTVVRKFSFTAHQAALEFGYDALSNDMKAAYNDKSRRYETEFEIWHLVMPRDIANNGNLGLTQQEMSWVNVYIEPRSKHILREGGYYEFPYVATRFIRVGNNVYGESPLEGIKDIIDDSISMSEAMRIAGQRSAIPSIKALASMAGEIDLRAGGVTLLQPEEVQSGLPTEWASASQYPIGHDLLDRYNQEIDDALFISVLQVISSVERTMTATEVQARESEKIMTFTQTFTQFVSDLDPFRKRIFCIAYRLGELPDNPPEGIFQPLDAEGRYVKVLAPNVRYIGSMAKALERNKYGGLVNTLGRIMELYAATQDTDLLLAIDVEKAVRYIASEENVPVEVMRTPKEVKSIKNQRAQLAAMQEAAQTEQMMAAANRDNATALSSLR